MQGNKNKESKFRLKNFQEKNSHIKCESFSEHYLKGFTQQLLAVLFYQC